MAAGTRVPAAPVRAHVKNLIHQGMTQAAIIRASGVTSPYLSMLLYGEPKRGNVPVRTVNAYRAARLLAIRYEPSEPNVEPSPTACPSGQAFEPAGYKVGRCLDCGQIAPVQIRAGREVIFSHPSPEQEVLPAAVLPITAGPHPDCGSVKGVARHRREGTEICPLCKAAKGGYDAGRKSMLTLVNRVQQTAVPREQVEAVQRFCWDYVNRRPVPQLRQLAIAVVRSREAAREAVRELTRAAA